jgi:hypothetical protein
MNRKMFCAMFAALAIIAVGMQSAKAEIWDAYTDYSGTQSSDSVWQYLYMPNQDGTNGPYTPFDHYVDVTNPPYRYLAWDEGGAYSHYFFKMLGVPPTPDVPDILSDFGVPVTNVLAWRSPIDGVVDITIKVRKQAGEGQAADYAFFQGTDATPLTSGSVSDLTGVTHTFTNVPVLVGSMFYLHTDPGEWINADQTGVSFTVTTVPEPGTLVLLSGGLVGLLAFAWRKRK